MKLFRTINSKFDTNQPVIQWEGDMRGIIAAKLARQAAERGRQSRVGLTRRVVDVRPTAQSKRARLDTTTRNFLPLPARHEWGEGHSMKSGLLSPALSSSVEEREKVSSGQAVVVSRCAQSKLLAPMEVAA